MKLNKTIVVGVLTVLLASCGAGMSSQESELASEDPGTGDASSAEDPSTDVPASADIPPPLPTDNPATMTPAEAPGVVYEDYFADSDGDGVFDAEDLCPGTMLGRPVDALGCDAEAYSTDVDDFADPTDFAGGATATVGPGVNTPMLGR